MIKKVLFFFGVVLVCFGILWGFWLTQDEINPYTGEVDRLKGMEVDSVLSAPIPEFVVTRDLDTIGSVLEGVTYFVDSSWFNEEEELSTCFELVATELVANEGAIVHVHSFYVEGETEDEATTRIDPFIGLLMTKGVRDDQVDLLFIEKKLESTEGGFKGGLEVHISTEAPL